MVSVLLFACSSSRRSVKDKFDAPMRQKLSVIEKNGGDESIKFFGKCSHSIDGEMRKSLENSGVKIETVVGDIFTGAGTPGQIRRLAALDFVTQVNLSTTSKPIY